MSVRNCSHSHGKNDVTVNNYYSSLTLEVGIGKSVFQQYKNSPYPFPLLAPVLFIIQQFMGMCPEMYKVTSYWNNTCLDYTFQVKAMETHFYKEPLDGDSHAAL